MVACAALDKLAEALNSRHDTLRRDDCGDPAIFGRFGHDELDNARSRLFCRLGLGRRQARRQLGVARGFRGRAVVACAALDKLAEALNSRHDTLRRDDCGDRFGHDELDKPGFMIVYTGDAAKESPRSPGDSLPLGGSVHLGEQGRIEPHDDLG